MGLSRIELKTFAFLFFVLKINCDNHVWMNNIWVICLHNVAYRSEVIEFSMLTLCVIYTKSTPTQMSECHLLSFCRVTNLFYESKAGHQTTINQHILSKINKQVYQEGSSSSFQETLDLFLPRATGLPGKWVNSRSAGVLPPATGKY